MFTLDGTCISYKSNLQTCKIKFIMKAEYITINETTKETIRPDRFIIKMKLKYDLVNLHHNN